MEIRDITQDQMASFTSTYHCNKVETVSEKEIKQESSSSKQEENTAQDQEIFNLIEKVNGKFEIQDRELSFSIHDKTKQIMIKVVNKETKEVIKEIPSEKILDIVASMMEVAGLIVDKRG